MLLSLSRRANAAVLQHAAIRKWILTFYLAGVTLYTLVAFCQKITSVDLRLPNRIISARSDVTFCLSFSSSVEAWPSTDCMRRSGAALMQQHYSLCALCKSTLKRKATSCLLSVFSAEQPIATVFEGRVQ